MKYFILFASVVMIEAALRGVLLKKLLKTPVLESHFNKVFFGVSFYDSIYGYKTWQDGVTLTGSHP